MAPGDVIPAERELCAQYSVSRPTVRQAVDALAHEGLLERRRGVGTFVAQPKVSQPLISILGFSERIEREGRVGSTRLLESGVLPAAQLSAGIVSRLQLASNALILRLVRLRLVDGEPHLLQTVHLPLDRLPGIDTVDFERESLYRVLRARYDIEIAHVFESLEAVLLKPEQAQLLSAKRGQPSIQVVTTTYDQREVPIEHTFSLARSDRSRHTIEFHLDRDGRAHSARLREPHLEVAL